MLGDFRFEKSVWNVGTPVISECLDQLQHVMDFCKRQAEFLVLFRGQNRFVVFGYCGLAPTHRAFLPIGGGQEPWTNTCFLQLSELWPCAQRHQAKKTANVFAEIGFIA